MIIGISGKKQSGKDTVGKIIQYLAIDGETNYKSFEDFLEYYSDGIEQYPFEIKKFADKVKDIVCLLINCTREQLEEEEFKNTELGEEWWIWRSYDNNTLFAFTSQTMDIKYWELIKLTPRKLLQLVGTECGRDIIHPSVWVNSTMSEYNIFRAFDVLNMEDKHIERLYEQKESQWIITDVRFPNELKAIEGREGFVIRIEKEDGHFSKDIHPSETALDNAEFKYVLQHQKDLNILVEQVKEILIKENVL